MNFFSQETYSFRTYHSSRICHINKDQCKYGSIFCFNSSYLSYFFPFDLICLLFSLLPCQFSPLSFFLFVFSLLFSFFSTFPLIFSPLFFLLSFLSFLSFLVSYLLSFLSSLFSHFSTLSQL